MTTPSEPGPAPDAPSSFSHDAHGLHYSHKSVNYIHASSDGVKLQGMSPEIRSCLQICVIM